MEYAEADRVFDPIELLQSGRGVGAERVRGRTVRFATPAAAKLREKLNPILARRDLPLELSESGQVIQRVQEPFRRRVEQPLPETTPRREVSDRVADAIEHFRRRHATAGDRRAAVKELADVLEFLPDDVKEHMLNEDERALSRLANEFAIRHNKRQTRRDFD